MKRNCVSVVIFLLCTYIFSGCGNSGVDSNSETVNISGTAFYMLNIPAANLIVKVNDKSTTTSNYGKFVLNDIKTPYDIMFIDTINKIGFSYKGINNKEIEVTLPLMKNDNVSSSINITYPSSLSSLEGKAIFVDENQRDYYSTGINKFQIDVSMNPNTSLKGKLIVLLFTRDNSGNIISYERYGEKDNITLNAGSSTNVNFDISELQLNPGETNVSGSFAGYTGINTTKYFTIAFGKRNSSRFLSELIYNEITGNDFNLVLPANLPSEFTPRILLLSFDLNITESYSLPKTGSGINLGAHDIPTLINPVDNAINIDTNTLFEWSSGSSNGIYKIEFTDLSANKTFYIYTKSLNTTLQGLNSLGFGNLSSNIFKWRCEKIGNSNSMDDYLNPTLNNIEYYKTDSPYRNFTIK
jgi:hypothetical protein